MTGRRSVRPDPRRAAAIGPIPTLPIFFKLRDRPVVLAGGGAPAVWKAELLAAAGAHVIVCDPEPCGELETLADGLDGAIELRRRDWQAGDFDGAALAIGALEGEVARLFRHAAQTAGVPVNIIDNPDLCEFQFGTIVERSPLLIAISTDGAAPVFGQALRARIEALLPAGIGAWARAAKDWRPALQAFQLGFAARRRFWEMFADRAFDGTGRPPDDTDRAACLAAASAAEAGRSGRLVLVGAGPGAPDLVTLRAVRALQSADIIVYQPDLDPGILDLGRREADRRLEDDDASTAARLSADLVMAGRRVALVGLGSPGCCERWTERQRALAGLHLPYEIVDGLPCDACPSGRATASINDPA